MSNNVNFPGHAWQDLVYFVDVEVEKIQDTIQCYKILKVYFQDTQIKELTPSSKQQTFQF